MQITATTESEAEHMIAQVWLVLEANGLPSPTVTCKLQSSSLTVELQFQQKIHEELVRKELLSAQGHAPSSRQPRPLGIVAGR